MEKKNNGLIIVLVLIILCLGGFILYDKDVLGLKGEKKESSTTSNKSSKKDESIAVGSVGNKETKIKFDMADNIDLYFYIKDGKVVFHKQDGSEVVDSTIPDKVIQIAKGSSCNSGDARLVALTDKGEIYYNKYDTLESTSIDDYNYKFDFIKVITEGKVYGIDSVKPNVVSTCTYTGLYAYVNKDEMRKIELEQDYTNTSSDGQRKILSASLGHTYSELYPYEKYYIIFNLDGPVLFKDKDGKLYFEKGRKTANEDMYLTINGNYIYADEVYFKSSNDTQEERIIIDKNKKVYLLIVSVTKQGYFEYTYTVKNTEKVVKNIKNEKNNDNSSKITLEYTDGTSEVIN